ncbi:MAG: 5'/3'-nucleotidase SurE [Thermoanaerobaculia bacterium]|nr:5'/3'-nucleotidase SurE [Thermoanaerobaculia bacterium]
MSSDLRLLLTNDDGVDAKGLRALAEALRSIGEVTVVAPDREQSATGHSLTLDRPLRLRELGEGVHAVDGTPTDCVNLAILWLMEEEPPDLVVSGINHGLNLGDDVTYSGTVSATFEGVLLGVPSIAFSQQLESGFSFERSAEIAARLVGRLLAEELPRDLLLNVNLPAASPRGVNLTKLGKRVYQQVIAEKKDPRGRRYFWIAGTPEWQEEAGSDHEAISDDRVSVTPLHLDLTDYDRLRADPDELLERLREPD